MSLVVAVFNAAVNGKNLSPEITLSSKYKHWVSVEDNRRCLECTKLNGTICMINEKTQISPPIHPKCRCTIEIMQAIKAGTATINGVDGADWTLKYTGLLPKEYVDYATAFKLGWRKGKSLSNFLPGRLLNNGIYKNSERHLPQKNNRVWYETDINYNGGKRNNQRIVWSNDGLVFVTYDHYQTFYEIIL